MRTKNSGREGPNSKREPPEPEKHDAALIMSTEDLSSGLSNHTDPACRAQTSWDGYSPDSLFEVAGVIADGCQPMAPAATSFAPGDIVFDTDWHACGGFTVRMVFTATSRTHHRQWMQDLLFSGSSRDESAAQR